MYKKKESEREEAEKNASQSASRIFNTADGPRDGIPRLGIKPGLISNNQVGRMSHDRRKHWSLMDWMDSSRKRVPVTRIPVCTRTCRAYHRGRRERKRGRIPAVLVSPIIAATMTAMRTARRTFVLRRTIVMNYRCSAENGEQHDAGRADEVGIGGGGRVQLRGISRCTLLPHGYS